MAIDLSTQAFTNLADIVPASGTDQIINTGTANTLGGNDRITGTGTGTTSTDGIGSGIFNDGTINTGTGNDNITGTGIGTGIGTNAFGSGIGIVND
jgi:hypothetical protein